jgi:hypothetical protein
MLTNQIHEQLTAQNLKLERFQEIVTRLLASGIVVREEDGVEQRMYDDALRIEDLLNEWFCLMSFRLVHDIKNEFFRLYAPGAQVPGIADADGEPVAALRARLSPDFVAAALALRFMYQQGLADGGGRITDAGEVLISFEELAATMQTQVKRSLPGTPTERKNLLAELKKHRLIQYGSHFSMTDEDALIAVRPTILGIIGDDALAIALEAEGVDEESMEQQTEEAQ